MALPFSQSMRSLQAERGLPVTAGLIIGLFFLLLWSGWFFLAPVTRYTNGTFVGLTREGRVVADFPLEALPTIHQGQAAYIRLQPANLDLNENEADTQQRSAGAIPAIVADIIDILPEHARVTVEPQIYSSLLEGPAIGEVAIEIERVSPATLVARASGQYIDTPSLSLSPQ